MAEKSKQRYLVPEVLEPPDDTSFKLCFCTMFLLMALFTITSIVVWSLPQDANPKLAKVSHKEPGKDSAHLFGSGFGKMYTKAVTHPSSTLQETTEKAETLPKEIVYVTRSATKGFEFLDYEESEETEKPSTHVIDLIYDTDEISTGTIKIPSTQIVSEITTTIEESSVVSRSTEESSETEDIRSSQTQIYSAPTTESISEVGDFVHKMSTTTTFPSSTEQISEDVSTTFEYNSSSESRNLFFMSSEPTVTESSSSRVSVHLDFDSTSTVTTTDENETTLDKETDGSQTTTTDAEISSSTKTELLDTNLSSSSESSFTSMFESTTMELQINTDVSIGESKEAETTTEQIISTERKSTTTETAVTCPVCNKVTCPVCEIPTCSSAAWTTTTPIPTDNKLCKSNQCYTVASRMLSLMDVNVDPCEDFYSFACGGIFNNPNLLEDDPSTDVWKRIQGAVKNLPSDSHESYKNLKQFFDGCVHYDELVSQEDRKKQGSEIIKSIGEFADSFSSPESDFTELLIKLFQHGSSPLFDLQLDVDSANSSKFQVVVMLPDWLSSHFQDKSIRCRPKPGDTLPSNLIDAYDVFKNCMGNFSEFIDDTQKALEYFGLLDHMTDHNATQFIQEIRMSVELDILDLIQNLPTRNIVQKHIQSKSYKLIPKIQLDSEIPQVSWSYLFSTLLNVEVADATNVQVYFMDYLKDIFTQLQTKNVRTVHNSLLAIFAHDLYTDIALTHKPCDRENYCLQVTANLLPLVTSNLYLSTFSSQVDHALRKQVILVYQQLVEEMETKLKEATWLDEKTMNEVSKKLKFMSIQLPQKFNDSFLMTSIEECPLGNKQYLQDSICLVRHLKKQMFSHYSLDPHSSQALWPHFSKSFSTSTVFIYGLNTFMIPQPVVAPVYDKDMPKHVVMAKLGNVLAQGIGHNFDHTGVKFVAGGKIGMMLSEATNPTYEAVVDSSTMQFSWTKSHKEDDRVYAYLLDPDLTLNERLSDITAVNLSLSVASNGDTTSLPWIPFTPKQVYFLAVSQNYCSKKKMPEVFSTLYEGTNLLPFDRVFNLATNSEQFALAFQCRQGTNMNMHSELKTRPFPLFEPY